jgi:hypothetical protein
MALLSLKLPRATNPSGHKPVGAAGRNTIYESHKGYGQLAGKDGLPEKNAGSKMWLWRGGATHFR